MKRLFVFCLLVVAAADLRAQCSCEPIGEAQQGTRVTVANAAELRNAITAASGTTEILLRAGEYVLDTPLEINTHGLVIRSESRVRTDVIIDGGGAGGAGNGFVVGAANFTLADMTFRSFSQHGMMIAPADIAGNYHISNVAFLNAGIHAVRVVTDGEVVGNVVIECCSFERTTPVLGSTGVMAENTANLRIHDCRFTNIRGAEVSAAAIVAGGGCLNVEVNRNWITDCDRGIVVGDTTAGATTVQGVTIWRNFIKGHDGSGAGIVMSNVLGGNIVHNTVYSPGGAADWSMELRYATSIGAAIIENLSDERILARDGAEPNVSIGNLGNAMAADFRDALSGDLHIVASSPARDAGSNSAGPEIDCHSITDGRADVGADEFSPSVSGVDARNPAESSRISYRCDRNIIDVSMPEARDLQVRLVDMMGQCVRAGQGLETVRISAEGLPAGAYLLMMNAGAGIRRIEKIGLGE